MQQITGFIENVTVEKLDFRVVRFREENSAASIIATGNLAAFQEEEPLVLHGDWTEYRTRRGDTVNQFKVIAAFRRQPTDLASLEKYLANAINGCGPSRAKLMVAKYGA